LFAADVTFTSSDSIIDGDVYDDVFIWNNATVIDMSGGIVAKDIHLYDASMLNMSGGTIEYDINIHDSGTATVFYGAAILDDIYVYGSGTMILRGGVVSGNLQAYGTTTVEIRDGSIGDNLGVHDSCEIAIRGGATDYVLWANDSSEVLIYGRDLSMTTSGGTRGYGKVTGSWADWSPFQINLDTASTHMHIGLVEIPEPATLSLLALGGLAMIRQRKRRDCK